MLCKRGGARFFRHCTFVMTTLMTTIKGGGRHSARKSPKVLGREAVHQSRPPTVSNQGGVARGPFQWSGLL